MSTPPCALLFPIGFHGVPVILAILAYNQRSDKTLRQMAHALSLYTPDSSPTRNSFKSVSTPEQFPRDISPKTVAPG